MPRLTPKSGKKRAKEIKKARQNRGSIQNSEGAIRTSRVAKRVATQNANQQDVTQIRRTRW